jgi:hypothetical protein
MTIMPTQKEMADWAEAQYLREKIAKLEGKPYSPTSTAGARFEGQQEAAKWQEPFEAHGRVVPPQREGESLNVYRIRLASMMQEYSPEWRSVNLHEAPSFYVDKVLGDIRADALKPESYKADTPAGTIKEIVKTDMSGRKVHEFVSSDNKTFIHHITEAMSPRRIVSRMFGVDRIGDGSAKPVEKPASMGRQSLYRGFPRGA